MQTVRDISDSIKQLGLTEDDHVLGQFLTREHLPQCAAMTDEQREEFCEGWGGEFADLASELAHGFDPARNPERERKDAVSTGWPSWASP